LVDGLAVFHPPIERPSPPVARFHVREVDFCPLGAKEDSLAFKDEPRLALGVSLGAKEALRGPPRDSLASRIEIRAPPRYLGGVPFASFAAPIVLVLAQTASGSAWSTGRPAECDLRGGYGAPGGRSGNVWERAKSPELRRYCDLVASAASKLAGTTGMAEQALASANEADQVLPGHAAPRVLAGRALEALGKLDEAIAAMADGRAREPGALDDPRAMLAWARAQARTLHPEPAAEAYRALLPRAAALPASDRSSAEIEAGLVAMAHGADRLDEAAAALREGVREAQDEPRAVAVLALALVLERRGDAEESRALLSERAQGDPRKLIATPRAKELLSVAQSERSAIVALALEPTDAAGARDAWQEYVNASPQGPWAASAKAHLAALGAGKGRRR
jgi:tetratricopeptide (TPR) repeat protein